MFPILNFSPMNCVVYNVVWAIRPFYTVHPIPIFFRRTDDFALGHDVLLYAALPTWFVFFSRFFLWWVDVLLFILSCVWHGFVVSLCLDAPAVLSRIIEYWLFESVACLPQTYYFVYSSRTLFFECVFSCSLSSLSVSGFWFSFCCLIGALQSLSCSIFYLAVRCFLWIRTGDDRPFPYSFVFNGTVSMRFLSTHVDV